MFCFILKVFKQHIPWGCTKKEWIFFVLIQVLGPVIFPVLGLASEIDHNENGALIEFLNTLLWWGTICFLTWVWLYILVGNLILVCFHMRITWLELGFMLFAI